MFLKGNEMDKKRTGSPAGRVDLSGDPLYEISADSAEAQALAGGNWWEWDGNTLLFGSCQLGTRGCCGKWA